MPAPRGEQIIYYTDFKPKCTFFQKSPLSLCKASIFVFHNLLPPAWASSLDLYTVTVRYTCHSLNNPRDDDHIVPRVLEVQMPKLWLGSTISRLQCWSKLLLHTNNFGCLGLTLHPWTVHHWLSVGSVDLLLAGSFLEVFLILQY